MTSKAEFQEAMQMLTNDAYDSGYGQALKYALDSGWVPDTEDMVFVAERQGAAIMADRRIGMPDADI